MARWDAYAPPHHHFVFSEPTTPYYKLMDVEDEEEQERLRLRAHVVHYIAEKEGVEPVEAIEGKARQVTMSICSVFVH